MNNIELKKGNTETNSRDLYWQKSYVQHIPLDNLLIKLLIITSYEYAVKNLGIDPYKDFEKIDLWLSKETQKLFDEFKSNSSTPKDDLIIRQFLSAPIPDINEFIENEA